MDSQEKFEKESDRNIGITGITICDIKMAIESLSNIREKVNCNSNTCRSISEVATKTDLSGSGFATEINNNSGMSEHGCEEDKKEQILNQHFRSSFLVDSNNKSDLEKDIGRAIERLISLLQEAKSSLSQRN